MPKGWAWHTEWICYGQVCQAELETQFNTNGNLKVSTARKATWIFNFPSFSALLSVSSVHQTSTIFPGTGRAASGRRLALQKVDFLK